nr:MAG TPA: hypothetical protein [Caudoviricetes sp.]
MSISYPQLNNCNYSHTDYFICSKNTLNSKKFRVYKFFNLL